MSMRAWIRRLFARPATRPLRKAPPRARLRVEALEDRMVPSTFTVTNTFDDGSVGSLRWAVGQANSNGGTDMINFDTAGTITLTQGELTITESVGIIGPGGGGVIISGNNASRIFSVFDGLGGDGVAISGLGLTDGKEDAILGKGGAIFNAARLTLTDCFFEGNSANSGGAIYNVRTVELSNCPVTDNTATQFGGGIYNLGVATVVNSRVTNNVCSDSGNSLGGAIYNGNGGTAQLFQSFVFGNSAGNLGGGIYNEGTATVDDSTVGGNQAVGGGGIWNNGGRTVTLTNSDFSRNEAGGGAGILNFGTASLTNCTVSDGLAAHGGGIDNHGTATLTNCTVAGNQAIDYGGGIENDGTVTLDNTIVAGDIVNNGALTGSHNLITDGSYGLADTIVADPRLGPLARNGGPTGTLALLAGSPAIDAGDNALVPAGVTTDQRGFARIFGGTVDIGAYEVQPIATTTAVTTSAAPSTYGDSVTFKATVTGAVTPTGSVTFVIDSGTPVAGIAVGTFGTTATWLYRSSTLAAGTHTVEAFYVGTGDFVDSNGTLSGGQTVNKANAAVVVTPYTVTYDGSPHTAAVTSITGETGAAVGSVTLNTTHTSAGTYASDGWSFTGAANYNDIASTAITDTINKANAAVVVTPYTVTYDGKAHTATITSITGVNGETGAAVGAVDVSNTAHTSAGTYASDAWDFTGAANYNDIPSTAITDVINKASSTTTVTIVSGSFTYSGLAQTPATVLVTGAGGLSLTPAAPYANNVSAGTATASYSFAGDANHEASSDSKDFTIGKADATVVVTPYTVTYDGSPHTATITSITGVNGETGAAVGAVDVSNTARTSAGTYSDAWSFTGAANYNDIASTTITDTINKAALTITANNDTKIFGTLRTFSSTAFTQTGLVAGDAITGVTETSAGAPALAAVGRYGVVPSAATGTGLGNYDIAYVNGTLTVFPAITVPAAQTAYESVSQPISGISIGSGLSGSLTLTLGVSHGTLMLGTTPGLVVKGNGSGSVSLTGSTAGLNAALATLAYRGGLNYSGADTLSLTLSAGGISSSASVAITVVSIAQQDAALVVQVKALQRAGVLTAKQANILLADLALQDNSGDVGKIGSFINDVHGYVNSHVLTRAQADALLGPANILLQGLTVQYGG